MNLYLTSAAALCLAMGIAHSWVGEKTILQPLFKKGNLPPLFGSEVFTRRTLRFTWHTNTILLVGVGALLLMFSTIEGAQPTSFLLQILSITFFIASMVAVVGSGGRHYSWVVFLVISVLIWITT